MSSPESPQELLRRLDLALAEDVARLEPRAVDLLRALIRTPSVTGGEGDFRDPHSVAGKLWDSLADFAETARHAESIAPGRDNVMAILGSQADRVMVLDAHTDTVPSGEAERWIDGDPFSAADGRVFWLGNDRVRLEVGGRAIERPVRRRLGRLWEARSFASAPIIYGRGSFDNKGPVAVAWLATATLATALARERLELTGTLVTAFVVDEEHGMAGTRALAAGEQSWLARHGLLPGARGEDGLRAGIFGVALDGSYGFVPIVGHRGVAQLAIRTSGQAAHAATPHLGSNAVTRMAAALQLLESEHHEVADRLAFLFDDALLEPATLAIGTTIAGGGVSAIRHEGGSAVVERTGINVVPDWCEATIDCRHPRPADGDMTTIRERIAATLAGFIAERTGLDAPDLTIEVISGGPPCAILERADQGWADPLVGAVLRHGSAVSGFTPWVETAPGGTDATVMINEGGIQTLVEFGPAGAFAHEPHEFVERDQIAVGALILARTIAEVLGVRSAAG
jgi:acetylornithine deacetylase/succinyl-diaminopimelate desuccinylase-like protein